MAGLLLLASVLCLIGAAAQAGAATPLSPGQTDLAQLAVRHVPLTAVSGTSAYAAQPAGKGLRLSRPSATSPKGTTTPLRPTLKWSEVSGASCYDFQILQGNTLKRHFNGHHGTSHHVSWSLPANVKLTWRVRARTAGSTGAWSKGMEFIISPPKPESPSGTIASATPTFRWNRLSGATKYQCSISGGGVQITKSGLTTLSYTFGRALPTNVPLTWKVRGSNPDGKGVWSRGVAFIVVPDTPPLTITADDQGKTYGTALSLGSSDFTTAGLLPGDSVTSVTLSSTGAVAAATVSGSPYAIVPSAAGGTGLGKYAITYVNGGLTVDKKGLTIGGAVANDKFYDGTTTATVDFTLASLVGVVSGDTVTLVTSGYSASFAGASVGTDKPVTVIGVTLGGADAGNYTVSQPNGLSADIIRPPDPPNPPHLPLTITANDQSKSYGDTLSLGSTAFTTAGLQPGDSVTSVTLTSAVAAATATVSGSPYAIVPSAATGTGLDRYDITYMNGSLTVGKKGLTISGARANDKKDDGTTTATVDFSHAGLIGVVGSDEVTITSSAYSASFDNANVSSAKPVTVIGVTVGGADAGNYTVSQPSGLTADITVKPPLTIIADDQSKTYGTALSLGSIAFWPEGLVDGDTVTSVTLTSTGTAATAPVSGSPYAIVPSDAIGIDLNKYHINYVNGRLTVVEKGLTISGASASGKVYDGTTAATVDFTGASLTGVVGSDEVTITSSAYSASFASRTVGTDKAVTVTGVTLGGADAGNYTVSQPSGLSAAITARNLTISGALARDKFQDGTTAATVDFSHASLSGVIGGDAVTIVSSGYSASFDNAITGTGKPVTGTGVTLGGADAGNYTVSQPSGLSADIALLSTAVSSSTATLQGHGYSASCFIPSGTTTGDLVFAIVQARNRWLPVPPVVPYDSSWTKIGDYSNTGSISGTTNYFYYALYYLQVGATVPWRDRWDFSSLIDNISVTNVTYRGASYDTASNVPYTTDDTLLTAGSVTPAATGELLLFAGGAYDPSEIGTVKVSTAPAGFTTDVNVSSNSFAGYFALATAPQARAAASGTKTATLTVGTDLKQAWLIALRP